MTDEIKNAPLSDEEELRRGFLVKFVAALVGGMVAVIPAVFGGGFFMTPLLKRKNGEAETDGFMFVGNAGALAPGGGPQAFRVTGIKHDAWTTYAEAAIGKVYVSMADDGALTAFNASCPHLGCAVNYKPDAEKFICPCHDSAFQLDGTKTNDIPPRGMDTLEVEIRNDNEVWVKFQNFRAGTSEKIPV